MRQVVIVLLLLGILVVAGLLGWLTGSLAVIITALVATVIHSGDLPGLVAGLSAAPAFRRLPPECGEAAAAPLQGKPLHCSFFLGIAGDW